MNQQLKHRAVAWLKDDPFGVEFAEVTLGGESLTAVGIAVGTNPVTYRLDYTLETSPAFVTSWLRVETRGQGWRRTLKLTRDRRGAWNSDYRSNGDAMPLPHSVDMTVLSGALDCDLGLSPMTNSMPVLRHSLLNAGGPLDFQMAWISVPDLSITLSGQRYTFVRSDGDHHIVRFEDDSGFSADITFDDDGLVVDYPGIARRLGLSEPP